MPGATIHKWARKVIDQAVLWLVLLLAWAAYEAISSKEHIEYLVSLQENFYVLIGNFDPWLLATIYWRHFMEYPHLGQLFGAALFTVEELVRKSDYFGPIYLFACFESCRYVLLQRRKVNQGLWTPWYSRVIGNHPIYAGLCGFAMAALLISFACFSIQICMLSSLFLFGWLIATAKLFAAVPFICWCLVRQMEHITVERLMELYSRLMSKKGSTGKSRYALKGFKHSSHCIKVRTRQTLLRQKGRGNHSKRLASTSPRTFRDVLC